MQVDLGGGHPLVSEPERDDGGVDTGLKQLHRGGVAEGVRRDRFLVQRWADGDRRCDVLSEPAFEAVAAEPFAATGWKQRVVGLSGTSASQTRSTATVIWVSGVMRCLRPLPRQLTWVPWRGASHCSSDRSARRP